MRRWLPFLCSLLPVTLAACAETLPAERPTAKLYRDLQRLVILQEATGWRLDSEEVRDLLPEALMSVCRADANTRDRLSTWLDERVAALGGPVEQAYRSRGKDLDAVEELLEATRVRLVHREAVERAASQCPFWLEPRRPFPGYQIADDRWLLSFGGGGKLIGRLQDGEADVAFGGAGRMAFGRAIGRRWAVLAGFEFGGSAAFPRATAQGEQNRGSLVIAFDTVFQPLVRYRLINAYFELESGYLLRFTENDTRVQSGIHVGIAYGLRAARKEWPLPGSLFPGAAFAIIYERTFPRDGQSALTMVKLGVRGAFDVHY